MIRLIKSKLKRKNPILHEAGNLKYEIRSQTEYDEYRLISSVSKILNRKFKYIINKLPIIVFTDEIGGSLGQYDFDTNEIYITNQVNEDWIRKYEYVIIHEIGHFLYRKWLSKKSVEYFENYIEENIKTIDYQKLYNLYIKYGENKLKIKFPIIWALIYSLKHSQAYERFQIKYHKLKSPFDDEFLLYVINEYVAFGYTNKEKRKVFSKPASSYMLDTTEYFYMDELFCEIFANYMLHDINLMHNDNYKVLKKILPELRN